jgi:hypothetical protein
MMKAAKTKLSTIGAEKWRVLINCLCSIDPAELKRHWEFSRFSFTINASVLRIDIKFRCSGITLYAIRKRTGNRYKWCIPDLSCWGSHPVDQIQLYYAGKNLKATWTSKWSFVISIHLRSEVVEPCQIHRPFNEKSWRRERFGHLIMSYTHFAPYPYDHTGDS